MSMSPGDLIRQLVDHIDANDVVMSIQRVGVFPIAEMEHGAGGTLFLRDPQDSSQQFTAAEHVDRLVAIEREAAHQKHGVTSIRSAGIFGHRRLTVLAEEHGEVAKVLNDRDHSRDDPSDDDEQFASALLDELVQVAAMASDWAITVEEWRRAHVEGENR